MNAGISLREADGRDLDAVLSVENASFTDPWTKGMFEDALSSPFQKLFLLCENGKVIGYICVHIFESEGEIMSVAVRPEYRRMGLGRTLVRFALGLMEKSGVKKVFLEARSGNTAAINLYTSEGFSPIGIRKNYYSRPRENAIVFIRTTDPTEKDEKQC